MADLFAPNWPAPASVQAWQTVRTGGVSPVPWASFNLGDHVGDAPARVAANRALLAAHLPAAPIWLQQVHGTRAVDAADCEKTPVADAAYTRQPGVVCAVMTADCLPILLCDRAGQVVAAVHAGWRGLLAGVVETCIAAMACPPGELLAWLGPAIGPSAFEVGDEVRAAFVDHDATAVRAFVATRADKWLANLPQLARQRLQAHGVLAIYGGEQCTVNAPEHYFSYRRDGVTGRMATLVWLAPASGV